MTVYPHHKPQYATGWIQTMAGRRFYPLDPRIEDIHIADIAAHLSKLCRFGGACLDFYSVAEHSVLVARRAPPRLKLTALLHDASEAYLVDVPRPLKTHLTNYNEIEDHLAALIAKKFGTVHPLPDKVKKIDRAILRDERMQNMTPMDVPRKLWGDDIGPLGIKLQFWTPKQAEEAFLEAFFDYGGPV
jgi:hypothetical protein